MSYNSITRNWFRIVSSYVFFRMTYQIFIYFIHISQEIIHNGNWIDILSPMFKLTLAACCIICFIFIFHIECTKYPFK